MIRFKVKTVLNQVYPFYYKGKALIFIAFIIFTMGMGFNFLFEPFNVYRPEHKMSFFWICVVHSIVAALCFYIIPALMGKFVNEAQWKVKKELIFLSTVLLITGVAEFLIRDFIYDNPYNWSWNYLFEEIIHTFLVGSLFIVIIVPLNFIRLFINHTASAKAISFTTAPKSSNQNTKAASLKIHTHLKGDDFILNPEELILAKSEGNYIEVYINHAGKVEKLLKRLTIKDFESQLITTYPHILKTHRSYLVNLQKVTEVNGNAQGYILNLESAPTKVPVSRNMIPLFEQKIKQMKPVSA